MPAKSRLKRTGGITRLPGLLREHLAVAVLKTAEDIESHAKAIAPEDTGLLKWSINSIEVDPFLAFVTAEGEAAPYNVFVEFGTGRMGQLSHPEAPKEYPQLNSYSDNITGHVAQPYMTPAADAGHKYAVDNTRREMAAAFREAKK